MQADLEEILPHASRRLRRCRCGLIDQHSVQGILLPWIPLAKGELADGVTQVKVLIWEGDQIMHVHVALLEGLARSKMNIASNLKTNKSNWYPVSGLAWSRGHSQPCVGYALEL